MEKQTTVDPLDKACELFERHEKSRSKKEKAEIKAEYNPIAKRINEEVGRKMIVLIH